MVFILQNTPLFYRFRPQTEAKLSLTLFGHFDMNDFVIVVGRQYGAGGRKLGRLLAESFGIPYFDKELLAEAAQTQGFSSEIFSRSDEKRPSPMRSLLAFCYGSEAGSYSKYSLDDENIYRMQCEVIRAVAARGGAVIVGRTADYILRDHPKLISIFVHAPEEVRASTVHDRGECQSFDKSLEKLRKMDRNRESYYNYYTKRRWGVASSYDLTFDSSKIPTEMVVDAIKAIMSKL